MYPENLERMILEEKELHDKWRKLTMYIGTDPYMTLDFCQRKMLIEQQMFMWGYIEVLRRRIKYEKSLNGDTDGDN